MSDYDADILAWSEHQGSLLKRLADGERVNDQVDWPNVVEEITSVGRSQLSAVRSLLLQSLIHMLKAEAWPLSRDAPTWRADALRFRADASEAFSPSMRQQIDVPALYAKAWRLLPETIDGQPPLPVPGACPVTLEELLEQAAPTTTQAIVPNGHPTGHKENEKRANPEAELAILMARLSRPIIKTEPKKAPWNERDRRQAGWFCVAALAALVVSVSAWLLDGRPLSPAWGFVLWTEVTTFLLVFAVDMFLDWLGIGHETEKARAQGVDQPAN